MAEFEFMDLYKEEFDLNLRDVAYKYYTRDEQIERYARNAAFLHRLYSKYCSHEVLEQVPTNETRKS